MHIIIDKLTPVTILILFLSYKRRAILLGVEPNRSVKIKTPLPWSISLTSEEAFVYNSSRVASILVSKSLFAFKALIF